MNNLSKINVDGILYNLVAASEGNPNDMILLYSQTPVNSIGYTTNTAFLYGNSLTIVDSKKIKILKPGLFRVTAIAFGFTTNGKNYMYLQKNDEDLLVSPYNVLVYNDDITLAEGDVLYAWSKSDAFQNHASSGCFICVIRIDQGNQ